jgi:hypothetical protein
MTFTSIDDLRVARDAALISSDVWLTPDFPRKGVSIEVIFAYRISLRDLPQLAEQQGLENTPLPTSPI